MCGNPRGDFEIEGVSQDLIDRFSKRHREIDEKTQELLARQPEKAARNVQEIRANIAHKERARKIKDVGLTKMRSHWKKQLSFRERFQLHRLDRKTSLAPAAQRITPEQAVSWAEHHLFDRRSVVHEHEIWRHALDHARGQDFSLWEIQSITSRRDYVRGEQFQGKVTTREVINREWEIVCLARDGIGRYGAFVTDARSTNVPLGAEQRQAVEHILSSRDFVTLFRGGAGTGKSYTLREVHSALKRKGCPVQVLTVCQPKELALSNGDRLQLKANSKAQDGRRLANGELVTIEEIHADGRIALEDGRVLPKDYRQFVRGYAVTSYAAQGKTVDYVLFSDSAVKAATNDRQWYVTISRGRKGVQIFTADKHQLRQNIARSGDRPLALDIAKPEESFAHRLARIWKRDVAYVFDVRRSQHESAQRQAQSIGESESVKPSETVSQSQPIRQARSIAHKHHQTQTIRRGMHP